MYRTLRAGLALAIAFAGSMTQGADAPSRADAERTLRRAVGYFVDHVATEGGYAYHYTADLSMREGERPATVSMVWVQPPGTPAVGLALLNAYEATGDRYYLDAAHRAALALVRGQLRSGGWDYHIEFDPQQRQRYAYRVAPTAAENAAKAQNTTTLDDDNTQASLRLLMAVDRALEFKDAAVHEAAVYGLDRLLEAQYPNGAWPQRFSAPPERDKFPVRKASYPDDWSREWPGSNYLSYYTFNDQAMADLVEVVLEASRTYDNSRYLDAAKRCGDFMLLAQMPEPQPAWAQQYDAEMHPAWARKFEPPSVTGGESQTVMQTLMLLYDVTADDKYLKPIPRALEYLEKSQLSPGRIPRFLELKTNKPLYFTKDYVLTYSSDDMPTHYSFITSINIDNYRRQYDKLRARQPRGTAAIEALYTRDRGKPSEKTIALATEAIARLDDQGRWIEEVRFQKGKSEPQPGITSRTFIQNVQALSAVLAAPK